MNSGEGRVLISHDNQTGTLRDVDEVLRDIWEASEVVTLSFHAAIVALAFGKALGLSRSNSHKNEGLAFDADGTCCATLPEAARNVSNRWDYFYPYNAKRKIGRLFDAIAAGEFSS